MEPVGLAVGIIGLAGLFSTCLDIVERWDSYKDSGAEYEALVACLEADRALFRRWGQSTGIDKGKPADAYHEALEDSSIRSAIDKILRSIEHTDGEVVGLPDQGAGGLLKRGERREKFQGLASRRNRIIWTIRDKTRFLKLVQRFNSLVQKLHELVPLAHSAIPERIVGTTGHIDLTSGKADKSTQFDFQSLFDNIKTQMDNETRKELYDWLQAHDTRNVYDYFLRGRLAGTCDWILNRSEFTQWQSSGLESSVALWINGPPGYGKTTLCARIVQHLLEIPGSTLAYFFLSSDSEARSDPFVVMRSWISQMLVQSQQVFNLAREKYETTNSHTASQTDIEELFELIVLETPNCTLIVDGLDECASRENDIKSSRNSTLLEFLITLRRIASKSKLRLLFTSRRDQEIRQGLLEKGMREPDWDLVEVQINSMDVESDATFFSESIVKKNLANKSEVHQQELSQMIVNRCQSMFLGIKLLEPKLKAGKNLKQLRQLIDDAPSELNHVYDREWERINNLDSADRNRALSILRWATFALRPLTISEITEIQLLADDDCNTLDYTELPDSIDDDYVKTEILELPGSLLEIRMGSSIASLGSGTIHLSHFSVREYLLIHMPNIPQEIATGTVIRSIQEAVQSNILAKTCIRYLNCEEVWKEGQQLGENEMIQAFRDYASSRWYEHVKEGAATSEKIFQLINEFFSPGNENWEAWRKHCEDELLDPRLRYKELGTGNPLFYASFLGFSMTVTYLLDKVGLGIDEVDSSKRTALLGASYNGREDIVRQLLQRGAAINLTSNKGMTPLHGAAENGNITITKLLLEKGASIDIANENGHTSLAIASADNHIEIVKLFIDAGADLNKPDVNGWTPLNSASDEGHIEIVKLLVDAGADLNKPNVDGWIPLKSASYKGHIEIVKLLVDAGADLNKPDVDGWTPLKSASDKGHIEIVKLLVDAGADLNKPNVDGWTPLHLASNNGHIEIVAVFLDNGADWSLQINSGKTAVEEAALEGHIDIVKLFFKSGAMEMQKTTENRCQSFQLQQIPFERDETSTR